MRIVGWIPSGVENAPLPTPTKEEVVEEKKATEETVEVEEKEEVVEETETTEETVEETKEEVAEEKKATKKKSTKK